MGSKGLFEKIGKKLEKAVTPNIKQANKILDSIPRYNISDKILVTNGKGGSLTLYAQDFVAFANKDKDNVIDKINKIGKLLATSLLTSTTTNKRFGFEDIYKSSKMAIEKFRNELFAKINKKDGGDSQSGEFDAKDDFEKLCKLLEDEKTDEFFKKMSEFACPGDADDKAIKSKRKEIEKNVRTYCKNIDKSFKAIANAFKNKELRNRIIEEVNHYSDEKINEMASEVLSREFGIDWKSDFKLDTKRAFNVFMGYLSSGIYLANIVMVLFIFPAPGKLAAFGFYSSMMIVSILLALFFSKSFQRRLLVKRFKNNYNKLLGEITKVYKNISAVKRYILSERKNAAKIGGEYDDAKVDTMLNQASVEAMENFVEEFKGIWSNYADESKRQYGYFEDQEKIARLEQHLEEVTEDSNAKKRLVERILGYLINFDSSETYTDIKNDKGVGKEFRTNLTADLKKLGDKEISKMVKKNSEVRNIRTRLGVVREKADDDIAEVQKQLDELKNKKYEGREKAKTSSMGLFKDGFAKTLANCTFVKPSDGSSKNKKMDSGSILNMINCQ